MAYRVIMATIAAACDEDEPGGGLAITLDELAENIATDLHRVDLVHDPARILKLPESLSADDVTVLQWAAPVQQGGGGSLVVQVPPVLGGDGQRDSELTTMSALVALLDGLDPEAGRRVALWAMDRWAGDVIDRG
jgi:hypothetical protein